MSKWLALLLLFPWTALASEPAPTAALDQATVIVVVGAPGEEEFGKVFAESADRWESACRAAGAKELTIGRKTEAEGADADQLKKALQDEPKEGVAELWLVLIGHGTFDNQEAKFNLRGPDLSATELAALLKPFKRPVAVIDTASASGPFINKLSAPNRVVITATRSGFEVNYTRFGKYLAEAIADPKADLDKDGQTSLLEAFLMAARRTEEFYKLEGRLATEHALLDDNGDGLGTPPDWFRGIRAFKKASDGASLDGARAHQFILVRRGAEKQMPAAARARRDELEQSIAKLRGQKSQLAEDEYYKQLEVLMLELARLYKASETP